MEQTTLCQLFEHCALFCRQANGVKGNVSAHAAGKGRGFCCWGQHLFATKQHDLTTRTQQTRTKHQTMPMTAQTVQLQCQNTFFVSLAIGFRHHVARGDSKSFHSHAHNLDCAMLCKLFPPFISSVLFACFAWKPWRTAHCTQSCSLATSDCDCCRLRFGFRFTAK